MQVLPAAHGPQVAPPLPHDALVLPPSQTPAALQQPVHVAAQVLPPPLHDAKERKRPVVRPTMRAENGESDFMKDFV
ncbi:MAG: hypothetical protein JNK82_25065 [Myxococcaceae bacterium]|nr:hypothetical protein [Myxococcaceae bacterium]